MDKMLDDLSDVLAPITFSNTEEDWELELIFVDDDAEDISTNDLQTDQDIRIEKLRQYYIDEGLVDVNTTDPWAKNESISQSISQFGRNSLHDAVLASDKAAVSDLLAKGVNCAAKDNNGMTALEVALLEESFEVAKIIQDFINNSSQ